jgi:hypothetical protein
MDQTKQSPRTSRRRWLKNMTMLGLGAAAAGSAWLLSSTVSGYPAGKEDQMHQLKARADESPMIPPIDRRGPSRFETAAFGLG